MLFFVLIDLLKNSPIKFIMQNYLLLVNCIPKKVKYLLFTFFMVCGFKAIAQQQITGTVIDSEGMPLIGVNVIVEGTNTGTSTDFDGKFVLTASSENVLVFSYVGFQEQRVPVGTSSVVNVTLVEDSESLDEVIVVAYGTATKKDLTGAVSSISSEELTEFPANSVDQAIQGKTAGVQVTQDSGAPGSSISVNIRGIGSFGNTTPLYVVDGFPTQDISFLNPNSIQSISVLKDASAGALYGVRASNGVVIIETKKGVRNKMTVSIDSWSGFRSKPKEIEVLNAQQFAQFASSLGEAQGAETLEEWDNPGSLRNINWQEYAFRSGFRMGHNVSVRGGGDKLRAAFTAGILDEEGIVIASSYKRYNVGLNVGFDISDNLSLRTDIKYSYNESYQNLGQGYYNLNKVFANVPYLSNTTGINEPYDGNGNYGAFTDSGLISQSVNVLAQALQLDNDNGRNVVLGNFGVDYDFFNDFTATFNFGFNSQNFAGWSFLPTYNRGNNNNDNNPDAQYSITQNTFNNVLYEGILEYNKVLDNHTIEVLVGASSQKEYFKNVFVDSRGFLNNDIRDLSQAESIVDRSGTNGTSTLASQFARVNYNYDSKYYLTATIRRDGNGDRFGPNNLWGIFPAFALSWNLDQESFMSDSAFDVLKLRGSWGETGNYFGIGPFEYAGFYNNGTGTDNAGYVLGGSPVQGLQPVSLPNPDLKWETQIQTNIGIEGELLNNRLYFTLDWFKKESSDFLFNQTIPSQTGFTSRSVNGGNVVNKGLEVLVGYRKARGEFTWDISANLTVIDNEITELVGDTDYVVFESEFVPNFVDNWLGFTRSYVGGNVGTFYGYRADGIFQTQGEIDALNNAAPEGVYQSADTAPGDRRFRDLNGDNFINGEDREVIGSPIPDFYGGLNLNGSYKNFNLGIDIYGSAGNDILNFTRVELETAGGYGLTNAYSNIGTEYFNNRWTPDNPSNTFARAVVDDVNQNNRVSDYFVEDGSFLRLRNIKLGYSFPAQAIESLGLTNANVYVSGQNLITLTSYSGWDPEIGQVSDVDGNSGVQTRGIDFGAYPVTRIFTLGVNLQF